MSERLHATLAGLTLRDVQILGISSLKTYAPTPGSLHGRRLVSVGRRGKYLVWEFDGGHHAVLHLSQAGRLDVERPPKVTRPRGSAVRFLFGGDDEGFAPALVAVLMREYGTHRKASWWVLDPGHEGPLAGLGPEPGSEAFTDRIRSSDSRRRLATDLRDQRFVAGIGRGWGDDIMHRARLSPFASLGSLTLEQRDTLVLAVADVVAGALELERRRQGGLSEASLGGRFAVHGRAGEPCPTPCGDTLRVVSYESYDMTYCPTCQTGGRVLADRRLSRLLK